MIQDELRGKAGRARLGAWRTALAGGMCAIALAALCSALYARHAKTCTGDLVRDMSPIGSRARKLPSIATAVAVSSVRTYSTWHLFDFNERAVDYVPPVFQVGPFQLRIDLGVISERPLPPRGAATLEDPGSCDGRALSLYRNAYFSALSEAASLNITLRRDAERDEWVLTFPAPNGRFTSYELLEHDKSDPVGQGTHLDMAAVAFRKTPKTLPRPSIASMIGGLLLLLGLRDLRHAARYFRRGGLASWREGVLKDGTWIEPQDGGPLVRTTGLAATARGPVLFALSTSASPTYRTSDAPVAARVCAGSREELRALHGRSAKRASRCFALACVALILSFFLPTLQPFQLRALQEDFARFRRERREAAAAITDRARGSVAPSSGH